MQSNIEDLTTVFLANTTELGKMLVPEEFENSAAYLKELVLQGMKMRFPAVSDTTLLMARIENELCQINCGGCENYFLIVQDYVRWAKEHSILCGSGRSTAPASLVCYCLGITEIDPIENNLIFERFYHPDKNICIYLDVEADKKDEVVGYITQKYSAFCVSVSSDEDEHYLELVDNNAYMGFTIIGSDILSELSKTVPIKSIPEGDSEALEELEVTCFEDIVALKALNSYGLSEFLPQYIARRDGRTEVTYPDVSLKGILGSTYGIMIYQEQLMQILHDYAGCKFAEADNIRRIMQKKQFNKHPELKEEFISAAQMLGHKQDAAEKIFNFLYDNAGYTYPRSHAVCEAKLAYWMAYIRRHHKKDYQMEKLKDYVVIDTETTGFSPSNCRIIEVCASRVRDGKIVETFTTLVNPECNIPDFIPDITGITDDMVCDKPCFRQIARELKEFIGTDVIVGHNIAFDIAFLNAEFGEVITNDTADTLRITKACFPNLDCYKLEALVRRFNLADKQFHRAESDVYLTYKLYEFMQTRDNSMI